MVGNRSSIGVAVGSICVDGSLDDILQGNAAPISPAKRVQSRWGSEVGWVARWWLATDTSGGWLAGTALPSSVGADQIVQVIVIAMIGSLLGSIGHILSQWVLCTAGIARVNDEGGRARGGPHRRDTKPKQGSVNKTLDIGRISNVWCASIAFNETPIGNQSADEIDARF